MSGHHSFNKLRERMTPERRAANAAAAADMNREYVLAQIRREMGITQTAMAERLEVAQPTYAAFERGDNLRVGTLRRIVNALGGVLKIEVQIDGRAFPLTFSGAGHESGMAFA